MNIELIRYGSIPGKGTFGEIHINGFRFFTVEREWLNNEPFVSSVPAGKYQLEPHSSNRHGETWALVNHDLGVYHWKDQNAKRYAILMHVANKPSELAGCVGIGRYLGVVGTAWAVTSSRHAMEYVLSLMAKDTEHTLTIRWAEGGEK